MRRLTKVALAYAAFGLVLTLLACAVGVWVLHEKDAVVVTRWPNLTTTELLVLASFQPLRYSAAFWLLVAVILGIVALLTRRRGTPSRTEPDRRRRNDAIVITTAITLPAVMVALTIISKTAVNWGRMLTDQHPARLESQLDLDQQLLIAFSRFWLRYYLFMVLVLVLLGLVFLAARSLIRYWRRYRGSLSSKV